MSGNVWFVEDLAHMIGGLALTADALLQNERERAGYMLALRGLSAALGLALIDPGAGPRVIEAGRIGRGREVAIENQRG